MFRYCVADGRDAGHRVQAEAQLFGPPPSPNQIVVDATNVLAQSVAMPSGLPQSMLAECAKASRSCRTWSAGRL